MSSIFVKHFELPCVERCYINALPCLALPCLALPCLALPIAICSYNRSNCGKQIAVCALLNV